MLKKVLLLIALVLNIYVVAGCTSSDSTEEGAETAEASSEEGGDSEAEESEDSEETASEDGEESEESEESEEGEEVAEGEEAEEGEESEEGEEVAEGEEEGDDEEVAELGEEEGEETEESEDAGTDVAANEPPPPPPAPEEPAAETRPVEPSFSETSSFSESPAPGMIPVKKIKDTPYRVGGILANAVYLARPGDTVESVSQKIYGSDRTADILAVNPNLKRGLKTGDKVYYNSPQRPTDDSRMMVYYEDAGVPAQTYTSKEGDNIRSVAKTLLGDENSWKEVWATNMDVESKGELAAGTSLRYWSNDAAPAAPPVAETTPPPPPEQVPPPPTQVAEVPPPPPPPADIPPPPPPPSEPPTDFAANTNSSESEGLDIPPPPPPPSMPVEPMKPMKKPVEDGLAGLMSDPNNLMILGVAAVAVLALVGFALTRRRRARIDFGQTQV